MSDARPAGHEPTARARGVIAEDDPGTSPRGGAARAGPRSGAGARRLLALTALAVAAAIGYLAFQNLGSSAVYYLTPTEARERRIAPGTTARLGGQVVAGTLRYDEATRDLRFIVSDGVTRVLVVGKGAPPALLREGAGAVVEGFFAADGTFRASQVIAKHDEVYVPPGPSMTPAHRTP